MSRQKTMIAAAMTVGLLALTSSSCGDDELSPEGFIEQYAKGYCDYLYRCCEKREISFGSKAQCESRSTEAAEALLAFRTQEKANARFASTVAQGCLDKLSGSCSLAPGLAGCLHDAVVPEGKVGDDCQHDVECDSFFCSVSGGSGVCVAQSTPGGGCGGDDRGCPEDYFCSNAKICVAKKAPGDQCDAPNNCESGICTTEKICASSNEKVCAGK